MSELAELQEAYHAGLIAALDTERHNPEPVSMAVLQQSGVRAMLTAMRSPSRALLTAMASHKARDQHGETLNSLDRMFNDLEDLWNAGVDYLLADGAPLRATTTPNDSNDIDQETGPS